VSSLSKLLLLFSLAGSLSVAGCSGLGDKSRGTATPSFTPVTIQGQYEVEAKSSATPGAVSLIEANFTQTGTDLFASKGNVVLIGGALNNTFITLEGVAGECDEGVLGQDSIQGAFTAATQANITLTESGALGIGTASANATFSSDGTKITSGTYTVPAQCGFQADSGNVIGVQVPPFNGAYAGILQNSSGGQDAVILTVSQSGLNLTVTGTDNGTPFTLTGSVVGATFEVSGTIAGQSLNVIGLYDVVNNDYLVYDEQGNYLGQLNAGSNPQAATKAIRFKTLELLHFKY
jgi:hypothetical protein